MGCEREKKDDTILIAAVLVRDVHSAQSTQGDERIYERGECSAVGDASY